MPCLVALIALAAPRLVLFLIALFSNYIGSAFASWVWPVLGFFVAPLTTLAYAWSKHTYGGPRDLGLVVTIVALLIDFGVIGGGSRARRRRQLSG
jgi:hypothetical protein